jgi:hypothetical protein
MIELIHSPHLKLGHINHYSTLDSTIRTIISSVTTQTLLRSRYSITLGDVLESKGVTTLENTTHVCRSSRLGWFAQGSSPIRVSRASLGSSLCQTR